MPVVFERDGDAIHMVARCESCGEYAAYGFNVHLREAIAKREPRLAGKWWCGRGPDGSGYCRAAEAQDLFGRVA